MNQKPDWSSDLNLTGNGSQVQGSGLITLSEASDFSVTMETEQKEHLEECVE